MKSGPFTLVGTSLTGKTIGIMGLGRIGKVIIEKSRGEVSPMGQDTIENVS